MRAHLRLVAALALAALAALGTYATIAAGFVSTPAAGQLAWAALAAVVAGGLAYLAATAGGYAWRRRSDPGPGPAARSDRRDRRIMLDRVRAKWIAGVLRPALERTGGLDPPLAWRPDAVDPAARLRPNSDGAAPAGAGELFDRAGRALLVLGEPGSGKTVLLLRLAQRLAGAAEVDETQPLPVVFNLASWARRGAALEDWLAERLVVDYQVPAGVAAAWARDERVLPLLDGLDEVPEDRRGACAAAIDRFREAHGFLPMAVTSRSAEYRSTPARLRLLGAVELCPLERPDVEAHLAALGRPADGVREALAQDPLLWELAETPLLLDVLLATYGEGAAGRVRLTGDLGARRRQLFDGYVDAMLRRRGAEGGSRATLLGRLGWLARQLIAHGQVVYYPEEMQPDWLGNAGHQRLVTAAPSAAAGALFTLAAVAAWLVRAAPAVVALLLLTALLAGAWAFSRRIAPASQAWWSWEAPAWAGRLAAAGLLFTVAVAIPFALRASNDDFQRVDPGALRLGAGIPLESAPLVFALVVVDPLGRLGGRLGPAGPVRRTLLTGAVAAVAVLLLQWEFTPPGPLSLAVAAVAGLIAAGVRAGLRLPAAGGAGRRTASVQALLVGGAAGVIATAWRIAMAGSQADAGHRAIFAAGWALLEAGLAMAAAEIVLPRAAGRPRGAALAAFATLAAAFAVLLAFGAPYGLGPSLSVWPSLLSRTLIAAAAFLALTGGPGAALARRAAASWPFLSARAIHATALAAAVGLGYAGIDLAAGAMLAVSAVDGLLVAFLVLLVWWAAVPPARGVADPDQLRRRTAAAGIGSLVVLVLLAAPGNPVAFVGGIVVPLVLLAIVASRAVLTRVPLRSLARDVGAPAPGRVAAAAALAGVVVAGPAIARASALTLPLLPVLVVGVAVLAAVVTFPAYAVVGGMGATHLDRSLVARPGQVTGSAGRNALAAGLFAAAVFGTIVGGGTGLVLSGLSAAVTGGPASGPQLFPLIGSAAALLAFTHWSLREGGRSLLQLLALRLLLAREGRLPWRAVGFLEEMTRLGLLRRAGSGHLFPHRLLMDHFAARPAEP